MEVNIVSQIDFELEAKEEAMFHQLMERCTERLKIEKEYTFSVIFVNNEQIHEINREYRHIDRPTDVISFALLDAEDAYETNGEECELGDIFMNIDAVHQQAKEYGHSFERELGFLFTHGMLHLLGYDHMNEEEEKEMFALQDEIVDEIVKR